MSEFVVYILYSEIGDRLYIGYSSGIIDRFKWHNKLSKKGFTIRYRPWKVIHVEFHISKTEAMQRERYFKSGIGRDLIRKEVIPSMRDIGFLKAN